MGEMELFEEKFAISRIVLALFLPKNTGTPIHRDRPTHGLVFNVNCTSVYRFEDGEVFTCRAGDLIYLPKGSNYTAKRDAHDAADSGIYAINFLTEPMYDGNRPRVMHVKGTERMLSLFSNAVSAWSKREVGYYEECMSDLYRIVKLLRVERARYAPAQRSREVLLPALAYIERNYMKESISVAHLSDLCGISEQYLRRLFRKALAVSPAVYIRDLRLRRAKELLQSGEYSVTEAALLAGFNDVSYFSREFKRATGNSPREYR